MMLNLNNVFRLLDFVVQGPITIKELSYKLDIEENELLKIIFAFQKTSSDCILKIRLYNENNEEILCEEDLDDKYFGEYDVQIDNDLKDLRELAILSVDERKTIYDLFNKTKDEFIRDERKIILDSLKDEFTFESSSVWERINVNFQEKIMNFNNKLLSILYEYMRNKKTIILTLVNGVKIYNASPKKIIYQKEYNEWYLIYVHKKRKLKIKLCKIKIVDEFIDKNYNYLYTEDMEKSIRILDKNGTRVKVRVYKERNAIEIMNEYFHYKSRIEKDNNADFIDYTFEIYDEGIFLRFIRSLTPSAVILEPQKLRRKMMLQLKKWGESLE